jgi:hypothetical protein
MVAVDAMVPSVINFALVALGSAQPDSDIARAPENAVSLEAPIVPGPDVHSPEAPPIGPSKFRIESLELSASRA